MATDLQPSPIAKVVPIFRPLLVISFKPIDLRRGGADWHNDRESPYDQDFKSIAVASVAASLTACASPEVVDKRQMGDEQLSRMQLASEIQEAHEFERNAQKEKGITGTNVAAAVIFWPAIIGTYSNANDAIKAAKARKEHLVALSTKKGCGS